MTTRGTTMGTYAHRPDMPAQEWESGAACYEHPRLDPEAWTGDEAKPETLAGQAQAAAQAVCLTECPVRDECLAWAFATDQRFGILGGMYASAREEQQRAANRRAAS